MSNDVEYIEKLRQKISVTERKLLLLKKEMSDLTMNKSIERYKYIFSKYKDNKKIIPFIKFLDKIKYIDIGEDYIIFKDDKQNLFSAEKKIYGDDIHIRYRCYTLTDEESYGVGYVSSWYSLCDILDSNTEQLRIDEIYDEIY